MANPVIVKPDKNGLIHFTHQGEDIVFQVAFPSSTGAASSSTPPAPNPVSGPPTVPIGPRLTPPVSKPRITPDNPFDRPHTYLVKPEGGTLDVEAATREMLRRFDTRTEPDPDSLVLKVRKLDLHALVELKRQISQTHPDLPLGVDLDDSDKP